jgi:hypothetical protein
MVHGMALQAVEHDGEITPRRGNSFCKSRRSGQPEMTNLIEMQKPHYQGPALAM